MMISLILILFATVAVMVWSANGVAKSTQSLAEALKVSPMLIALTAVAFGTSAPELVVSVLSALSGNVAVAVGNGIGSNMVNVGVVLAITLLITPLWVPARLSSRELPLLLLTTLLLGIIFYDGSFTRGEGFLLLLLLLPVLWLMAYWGKQQSSLASNNIPIERAIFHFVAMLSLLLISAHFMLKAAIVLAQQLGVSEVYIGLIVIAIGTSLPELVVSVAAALRGLKDVAIGSILGSNIFNLLGVIGIAGALSSGFQSPDLLMKIYLPLLLLTILLYVICYMAKRNTVNGEIYIGRGAAVALLSSYAITIWIWHSVR